MQSGQSASLSNIDCPLYMSVEASSCMPISVVWSNGVVDTPFWDPRFSCVKIDNIAAHMALCLEGNGDIAAVDEL